MPIRIINFILKRYAHISNNVSVGGWASERVHHIYIWQFETQIQIQESASESSGVDRSRNHIGHNNHNIRRLCLHGTRRLVILWRHLLLLYYFDHNRYIILLLNSFKLVSVYTKFLIWNRLRRHCATSEESRSVKHRLRMLHNYIYINRPNHFSFVHKLTGAALGFAYRRREPSRGKGGGRETPPNGPSRRRHYQLERASIHSVERKSRRARQHIRVLMQLHSVQEF